MPKDENIKLVSRALDEFVNKGNGKKVAEDLFTDDYVWHPGDVAPKMDAEMHVIDNLELRKAFPDIHCKVDEQTGDGDQVITHFTMTGTHRGPLVDRTRGGATIMGTGRKVTWRGVTVHKLRGGKIAEGWLHYDRAG